MSSYVTTDEADTYFETRFQSEEWEDADSDTKIRVLATSTKLMDNLNYFGTKTESSQELQFPRNGQTTIPTRVKEACYEISYALLEGRDPDYDIENINVSGSRFGSASVSRDPENIPLHVVAGIPSIRAWNLLRPYLNNSQTLRIERIS